MSARLSFQLRRKTKFLGPIDGFFKGVESDTIDGLFTWTDYGRIKRSESHDVGRDFDLWLREHELHERGWLGRDGSGLSLCKQGYQSAEKAPNPKHQNPKKSQSPCSKGFDAVSFEIWSLELSWRLEFGAWDFVQRHALFHHVGLERSLGCPCWP